MNTDTGASILAARYLAELEHEAQRLPADQAAELVADIRDHLSTAVAASGSEAHARDVLDRLGSPQSVVAEALGSSAPPAPTPPPPGAGPYASLIASAAERLRPSTTWSSRERTALACLIGAEVGFFLFPLSAVAWVWGLNRLTTSRVWTAREKTLGYLTLGLGFPLGVMALIAGAIAVPLSVFNFGLHQVCTPVFNPSSSTFPNSSFDLKLTAANLCSDEWSPPHALLTTAAVVVAVLLIAQMFAVWTLMRARHRAAPTG